jgi:serine/threonine-protein kinase
MSGTDPKASAVSLSADDDDMQVSAHYTQMSEGPWHATDPPPADMDDMIDRVLNGTYQIVRVLGEGGMGRVYEAQHTRIASKRFAVKMLHPEYARHPQVLERFRREAEASAAIESTHVVSVVDVDKTDDGLPYMVSELLEGKELGDFMQERGKVPVGLAVRILRQVCKGLAAAHARGVVHRDIKPENVYLAGDPENPTAKLIDFGISRLEDPDSKTLTKTGVIIGTPAYMSPEQARGERVDTRTDIYAAGAILYEALTGKLPFVRDEQSAILVAVLTEEPTRPRALEPSIPEALELVIQRAMTKSADQRYQTVEEFDIALAPYDIEDQTSIAAGRTMHASLVSHSGSSFELGRQADEVAAARPQLALLGALSFVGLLAGLAGTIGGALRLARDGVPPSATESTLILVALCGVMVTPGLLAARHVKRNVWDNTAKVLALVQRVCPSVAAGLMAYGGLALVLRLTESLLVRSAAGIAWAFWELLLPLFGLGVAIGGELLRRREGRGPSMPTIAAAAAAGALVIAGAAIATRSSEGVTAEAPPAASGASSTASAVKSPSKGASGSSSHRPSAEALELWKQVNHKLNRGEAAKAVSLLSDLVEIDPDAADDPEVRNGVVKLALRAYFVGGDTASTMTELLTKKMGSSGPDILFKIITTRGGTKASKEAARLLADPTVLARGSAALRVAYGLRSARTCKDKIALFEGAREDGDKRAITELRILQSCRRGSSCCLRKDERVKKTIAAIEARIN